MSLSVIIALAVQCCFVVALPLFLIFYRKKFGIKPVLFGALTYIVFSVAASGLLSVVFTVLLPTADAINASPLLYALFCGLCAAICEEGGRFLFLKLLFKKDTAETDGTVSPLNSADVDKAVNFGIGYGGFQSAIIIGGTLVMYIVFAVMINKGSITPNLYNDLYDIFYTVESTTVFGCFLGILERIIVTVLQIFLSITVYASAVFKDKIYLLPLAALVHFLYEFTAVLYSGGLITQLWIIEMVFAVITFAFSGIAVPLYKKMKIG